MKVNFQSFKSSQNNVSIIAYISYGFSDGVKEKRIKNRDVEKRKKNGEHIRWTAFETINVKAYKPSKVSTGIVLPKAFWDNKTKQATGTYIDVNDRLDKFKAYVESLFLSMSDNGTKEIDPKKLSDQIKIHITKKVKQGERLLSGKTPIVDLPKIIIPGYFGNEVNGLPTSLIQYMQFKIDHYTNATYFESGKGQSSIIHYKTLQNKFIEYKSETGKEFDLLTMTVKDLQSFVDYFLRRGKSNGDKYKLNYVQNWKKEIRTFLYKAKKDKIPLTFNLEEEDYFKEIIWEREDDPYLTFEHLEKLRKLKFDDDQKVLEYVRDYFLIGCNSGASIIDLANIGHVHHNDFDGYFFSYIRTKTFRKKSNQVKIKIPIRQQYVIDLYEKYKKINKNSTQGFNFNLSSTKFNKHLRSVCLLAGLTEPVEQFTQCPITGEPKKIMVKRANGKMEVPRLYETVSSKCMRKTFASNEVRQYSTPLSVVKRWTMHANESALMTYIMLDDNDYYRLALKHQPKSLQA